MKKTKTFNNKLKFKICNIFHISDANSSSKREQVTKRLKFAHLINRKLGSYSFYFIFAPLTNFRTFFGQ